MEIDLDHIVRLPGLPRRVKHVRSGIELVFVAGGRSTLGAHRDDLEQFSNEPQREETVDDVFLGVTPVTQAQWTSTGLTNVSYFRYRLDAELLPIDSVNLSDVIMFLELCGGGFFLPDEWQWEHACRAGSSASRYGPLNEIAHHTRDATQPVGRKSPNAFGLCEMLGMVWEWTSSSDPAHPGSKIVRGGSFLSVQRSCRASARYHFDEGYADKEIGFRVAATVQDVRAGLG